jgi:hypothetical protein
MWSAKMSFSPELESGSGSDGEADSRVGEPPSGHGLDALERALRQHLADEASEDIVRHAIAEWCADVHAARLSPEKTLVAYKRVLARIAANAPLHDRESEAGKASMARLVTLCIEEYYRQ